MANKTYDQCINRILRDVEKRKSVDYSDRASVRRYNTAMDRIVEHVQYIIDNHAERISDFIHMMYHPDAYVSLMIACEVINRVPCSMEQKWEAIEKVRELANDTQLSGITRVSLPFSIKRWEEKYPK